MIKTTLLLIIYLILPLQILAQQSSASDSSNIVRKVPREQKAGFLSFNLGGSIPIGSYSPAAERNTGYALPGINYHLETGLISTHHTGFGVSVGSFRNNLDEGGISSTSLVISNAEPYRNTYIFAGPYLTFPVKHFFIDVKCLGGLVRTTYPSFDGIITINDRRYAMKAGGKRATVFGYNLGTNIRIKTQGALQFKVGLDFIYAKPEIGYQIESWSTEPDPLPVVRSTFRQAISTLNVSWGLAFRL